jgi:hypothetical protein
LPEEGEISAEPSRQAVDRLLLDGARGACGRNELANQLASDLDGRLDRYGGSEEMPHHTGRDHDQEEASDDRQIDLDIEAPQHARQSVFRSKGSEYASPFWRWRMFLSENRYFRNMRYSCALANT